MIVNDSQLETLCKATPPLIQPFELERVANCTYSLSVGEVLEPASGESFDFCQTQGKTLSRTKILKPTECAIVITAETVNIPNNLMASYTPLNRNAKEGLMLINASIIEPGYSGPLSCVLVNLSATPIHISVGLEIAKVVFHQLGSPPTKLKPYGITRDKYIADMRKVATKYHNSFMNIESIVLKARDAAIGGAKSAIAFGGISLMILILFAQLEPIVTHWIWDKTGVTTSTRSIELIKQQFELEKQSLKLENETSNLVLQKEIAELRRQVVDIKKQKKAKGE